MKRTQLSDAKLIISLVCAISLILWPITTDRSFADTVCNDKPVYIPVLMYHNFDKIVEANGTSGATVTSEKFQRDMQFLEDNGYTPLLPKDLEEVTEGDRPLPKKPVMITIDDGYRSTYTIAYPILMKTNMKATIFVIAGTVENAMKSGMPKMKWWQMKEMYRSGHADIQSHSYDLHNGDVGGRLVSYKANGIGRQKDERQEDYTARVETDLRKSIELIEENVGNQVTCFSYPYGAYDEWGQQTLAKNGVKFGFGTTYGSGNISGNLYLINRFSVGMNTDLKRIFEPEK